MLLRFCFAGLLAALTLPGQPISAAEGDDDLPTKPAFGIIDLAQIKKELKSFNDVFKGAGMNEKFIKQFESQLTLALKAVKDGKFETSKHKEESVPVITGRMKDMIDVSQLKKDQKNLVAILKEKGVSAKVIQQLETQLDQAVTAASEGRFSIKDHREKSFTVIYRRLTGAIKQAAQ